MKRYVKAVLLAFVLISMPAIAASDTPTETTWRQPGALLDRSPQRRPHMFSFFLGFPYGYYGYVYGGVPFGLGVRYMIPLIHDGFVPSLNDSFNIEFGADFGGIATRVFYPIISIPVEVMWRLHFTSRFSGYVKVGAALEFNVVSYCTTAYPCRTLVSANVIANVGLIYRFTDTVSFRAEAGYPWLKVGLGFDI